MKIIILILGVFWLSSTFGFAQITYNIPNYKHKVFTKSYDGDKYYSTQKFIMKEVYSYARRFYHLKQIPNIYILNFLSGNIEASISFDMLDGCIISRNGKEGSIQEFKCGLRIECSNSIDSTLRLLDYGIINLKKIECFKDSILMLPEGKKLGSTEIPRIDIEKAMSIKLNYRKETYIKRANKLFNRRFRNLAKGPDVRSVP